MSTKGPGPDSSQIGGAFPASGPTHPADLVAIAGIYLVPWGKREMTLVGAGTVLLAAVVVLLAARLGVFWLLALVPILAVGGWGLLFFRNPRRTVPQEPGLFVAPADGRITDVGRVKETEYIGGPAWKVGIFLSVFNVHLNRAPCTGRVDFLRHRNGKYLDARNPASARENESQAIGILRADRGGPQGKRVLVHAISGAIARRIVCPLQTGQALERGGIIGMIKFGSRTELFVAEDPANPLEILVKIGDAVKAGQTVICRYGSTGL